MTQADSVHSTPPIDAPAVLQTSGTSRRSLLSIGAAAAAAAIAPMSTASAAAPDPVFAAIEKHKALVDAHTPHITARAKFKDTGDNVDQVELLRLNDALDETALPVEVAAEGLIDTMPTTAQGLAAALRYFGEQHSSEGIFMVQGWSEDEEGEYFVDWTAVWLETLAKAAAGLGSLA